MPGINYTLGMKTGGFDSGVSGALGKLAKLGKAAAIATAAGGAAAGVAIGAIIGKSIGKAAEMETLQTAFIPLLGGIKQAKDRIADLAAFAASTPFELPEIAAASKTLQGMTKGVLATGAGLTLVGDVASYANQSFAETATTIGRLYAALNAGRAAGEPLQRLSSDLAAISPEVRAQIEAMQKAGAKGADVWKVAEQELMQFSGSMKLQSGTWNGLMSTLKDAISMTMAKFGEPIMDSLKPYLEGATGQIEKFQAAAIKAGEKIGSAIGILQAAFADGKLGELLGQSLKVGFMEAVNTLAAGLRAAVAGMEAAMKQSMIGGILEASLMAATTKMAAVLQSTLADFAETVGRYDKAKGFRDMASAYDKSSSAYLSTARWGMENTDPGKSASAFGTAFQDSFKSGAGGIFDVAGDKAKLKSMTDLYTAQAAAAKAAREKARQDIAASVVQQPQVPGQTTPAALAKAGSGGATAADRLAQIGGYVGGAANGMANKAADATAKWTEATARGIEKLLARPLSETAATF